MAAKYYTILTEAGKAKLANAAALGRQIKLVSMAIGDGSGSEYDPVESQTELKGETYRTPISHLGTDAQNSNWLIAEGMIPVDVGGWFVREVGIFDEDGDLFAIGKYPETYKPTLAEGTGRDLYIRFIMVVSNIDTIDLKIDPTVEIATRTWVNGEILEVTPKVAMSLTGSLDMSNELMNVARADGYLDKPNLWSMRNVIMIGDSHGWGEGAPNYQGAGVGYSVHSPWIHNKGFFGRLVDHLYKKMDTEPWGVLPLAYRSQAGERKDIIYGRDNYESMVFKEFFTKTPIYARGRFQEYSFTANQGNNFTNRNVAAGAPLRGDSYAVTEYKYLASIGLFNDYQFEMSPDIHRENDHNITITSWDGYIIPGGWTLNQNKTGGVSDIGQAFVHIWPYTENAASWLYVDATVYISSLNAVCKVAAIDSYPSPNGLHTNVFLTYEDGSDIPLSEIEKIRSSDTINRDFDGQACVLLDLETPTRYVVLGVNHHNEGSIVEVDLVPPYEKELYKNANAWGDWTWGKSNVSIKVLTPSGAFETPGDYAVVDNTNFKITIDTSKASGYFMPYVIDFGQKKAGRLRIRHVGDGAEATGVRSWSGATSFACKGALVNNLDYIKNWSMGGHTIGAWLGQENSYWGEQRDHVADILSYTPVHPTAVIVETPLVNEWLKQTPLATFKQRLVDLAFAFNQGNMLVTTTLGTHSAEFGEDTANVTYQDYADMVKEWATESAGKVTLVDCRAHLKRLVSDGTVKSVDLYLNNGHPSPMANEIMFEHLKRIVDYKL